jgi:hypothetical protein
MRFLSTKYKSIYAGPSPASYLNMIIIGSTPSKMRPSIVQALVRTKTRQHEAPRLVRAAHLRLIMDSKSRQLYSCPVCLTCVVPAIGAFVWTSTVDGVPVWWRKCAVCRGSWIREGTIKADLLACHWSCRTDNPYSNFFLGSDIYKYSICGPESWIYTIQKLCLWFTANDTMVILVRLGRQHHILFMQQN